MTDYAINYTGFSSILKNNEDKKELVTKRYLLFFQYANEEFAEIRMIFKITLI